MGTVLRFVVYAVIAPFAPLVRFMLLALAFVGFISCAINRVLMHAPNFPLGTMLAFSVAACVAAAAIDVLVQQLASG